MSRVEIAVPGTVKMLFLCAASALGCASTQQPAARGEVHAVAWTIDNTQNIGGYAIEKSGDPKLTESPQGPALCFDGVEDAITFPVNPLDMQYDFTIQVLLSPAIGGDEIQQFLHVQDNDGESRVLFEVRTVDSESWRLHSFVSAGKDKQELENQETDHDLGKWYWVAMTYDQESGALHHYVNGYQETAATFTRPPMKRGEMAIGTRLSREHFFKGCVREVRFATAALPPDQLASTEQ